MVNVQHVRNIAPQYIASLFGCGQSCGQSHDFLFWVAVKAPSDYPPSRRVRHALSEARTRRGTQSHVPSEASAGLPHKEGVGGRREGGKRESERER